MTLPALYHVATLGCKLNQFDSASMEARLVAMGFRPTPDPAAARLVVVNTCTVTSSADSQSRQLIRSLRRANPRCTLLVTGCYAQRDPQALQAIAGVDAVVSLEAQKRIGGLVVKLVPELPLAPACEETADDPLPVFADRTRAFLKIQEGCDLKCSYCVIPSVRGASRSVPPAQVLEQLRRLIDAGFQEIVFTGVNTGDYGRDLDPSLTLAGLLRRAARLPGLGRLRLNSVEPRCVSEELVKTLAEEPTLAPHLQVPLQSGSDAVLGRMRRPYLTEHYKGALEAIRERIPHAGLGADVIVGFPGETEEEFEETRAFIESSGLNYLHVFSFTPRPGTPAGDARDTVPGDVIRRRNAALREVGARLSRRFRESFLHRELEVLGLRDLSQEEGVRALSGNFIEVTLQASPEEAVNRLLRARVTQVTEDRVTAVPA